MSLETVAIVEDDFFRQLRSLASGCAAQEYATDRANALRVDFSARMILGGKLDISSLDSSERTKAMDAETGT